MKDCTQDLFSRNNLSASEEQIEAAKKILLENGYRVDLPQVVNNSIDSRSKLKDYFYMKLDRKHPNKRQIRIPNLNFDSRVVAMFVESRKGGVSEKTAIQECIAIIDTLFDHENEFNFKYPIVDISVLGQGKMGWVTAKALSIMNRKRDALLEKEALEKIEAIENSYEIDVNKISNELDELLRRMEENNG